MSFQLFKSIDCFYGQVREVTAEEVNSHGINGMIEFFILTEKVSINPDTNLFPLGVTNLDYLFIEFH